MDELTQATPEVSADLNDIDISDIDFGADLNDDVEPQETLTEDATLETDEADPAEAEDGEAGTEEIETEETKETDQFSLKHLGEEKSVSRDEVITLAQKGMDYDRVRQKHDELNTEFSTLKAEKSKADETISFLSELAQEQGFSDVNSFVNETRAALIAEKDSIDITVARKQIEIEHKEKELAKKEAKLTAEKTEKDGAEESAKKSQEKQQADFLEFANEYKDLKPDDISKDVWTIYNKGGCSLVQAYIKHENAQLKAQLAADKKNAENKHRSTGSMHTAGNKTTGDPWLSDLESRI